MTAEPHHAGSPYEIKLAGYVSEQMKSFGLDVTSHEYSILIPWPGERRVDMQLWNWHGLDVVNAQERDHPLGDSPLADYGVRGVGVVKVENEHYFIGPDDVYKFDGSRPVSIGAAVREWLFNGFDKANLTETVGRHDPVNQLVYWHYRPTGASGALTKVLCYHYPTGRFGAFDLSVQTVFGTDNDKLVTGTSDGTARQLSMAYIDSSKYIKSLSAAGTDFAATTGWYGRLDGSTLLRRVRPKFRTAPSGGTCTPSTVQYPGASVVAGTAASVTARGSFDTLSEAFFHRFALALTGDPEIEAVQPELVPAGEE